MFALFLAASISSVDPHAFLYVTAQSCKSVIDPQTYQRAITKAENGMNRKLGRVQTVRAIAEIKSKIKPMKQGKLCNRLINQVMNNVQS